MRIYAYYDDTSMLSTIYFSVHNFLCVQMDIKTINQVDRVYSWSELRGNDTVYGIIKVLIYTNLLYNFCMAATSVDWT